MDLPKGFVVHFLADFLEVKLRNFFSNNLITLKLTIHIDHVKTIFKNKPVSPMVLY